ncbi:MAG: hypothetical protein D6160_05475 [Ketobacter sp.]|nr:MAG: hypothetical protein D6160_05475 [Ketobacter sp.]
MHIMDSTFSNCLRTGVCLGAGVWLSFSAYAFTPNPTPEPDPDPPSNTGVIENGRYVLINRSSDTAMTVASGSLDNGANVIQQEYTGQPFQQWDVNNLGNGYYSIRAVHSGQSLDVWEWNGSDGADVRQWPYLNAENQHWKIESTGPDSYSIVSRFSDKAIDVVSAPSGDGANVSLWTFTSGASQSWKFVNAADVGNGSSDDGGDSDDDYYSDDTGTSSRPLLTTNQATRYTIRNYLAGAGSLASGLRTDNWNPTAGIGDVTQLNARYVVATSGGSHRTVQSAINAAVSAGGGSAINIEVKPGTYREVLCVPSSAPPINLYSLDTDASKTLVVYNNLAGTTRRAGVNTCNNSSSSTYGTTGSATVTIKANHFRAKNMTFANDGNENTISNGGTQGVAILTESDQVVFENMRFLGNQDTFYAKTGSEDLVKRVYVKSSYIEGDVDFIFGGATMVFDDCVVHYLHTRQGRNGGILFAPSTNSRNSYGILVINSRFTAQSGTSANLIHLGRAWDEGLSNTSQYANKVRSGSYPNGQLLIRETNMANHIRANDPWRDSTASRPYSASEGSYPANRFHEYHNDH